MIPTAFQAGGPPGAAHRRSAARLRLLRAAVRLATRTDRGPGPTPTSRSSLGGGFGGGVVECETRRPLWLPYVEVAEISEVTERARLLGASVLLEPREGPAGWRSVVAAPAGAEVAFWQPKELSRVSQALSRRLQAGLADRSPAVETLGWRRWPPRSRSSRAPTLGRRSGRGRTPCPGRRPESARPSFAG